MRPTRVSLLAVTAVLAGVLGYLLAVVAYFQLSPLPVYAPVTLLLLAVVEAGMARVVRDRVRRRRDARGRPVGRPLHPLQVARAAVLAKASSPTGALLLGGYAGVAIWAFQRRDELGTAGGDALVAGLSALAALALVGAALLLERACRTPDEHDEQDRLSSRA